MSMGTFLFPGLFLYDSIKTRNPKKNMKVSYHRPQTPLTKSPNPKNPKKLRSKPNLRPQSPLTPQPLNPNPKTTIKQEKRCGQNTKNNPGKLNSTSMRWGNVISNSLSLPFLLYALLSLSNQFLLNKIITLFFAL